MEKENNPKPPPQHVPGDGIRSLRSTTLFRAINFELYTKPVSIVNFIFKTYFIATLYYVALISQNKVIMALGLIAMTGATGYILYMRSKYESMGYYSAVESDGTESFKKKVSKWSV